MAREQQSGVMAQVKARWHLYQYRRLTRRSNVDRSAATAYRSLWMGIVDQYPNPEPIPISKWFSGVYRYLEISVRTRIGYRRADIRALADVIR